MKTPSQPDCSARDANSPSVRASQIPPFGKAKAYCICGSNWGFMGHRWVLSTHLCPISLVYGTKYETSRHIYLLQSAHARRPTAFDHALITGSPAHDDA